MRRLKANRIGNVGNRDGRVLRSRSGDAVAVLRGDAVAKRKRGVLRKLWVLLPVAVCQPNVALVLKSSPAGGRFQGLLQNVLLLFPH